MSIDLGAKSLLVNNVKLTSVIITYKTFWGKIKTVTSYPTGKYWYWDDNNMVVYQFCDELGKTLSLSTCTQICNYLISQVLQGNIK